MITPPTRQRIREHFCNYLEVNLDCIAEDFVDLEYGDWIGENKYSVVEALYLAEARQILTKLRADLLTSGS